MEENLNNLINSFYEENEQYKELKKTTDKYKEEIKEEFKKMGKDEFITDTGLKATVTIFEKTSFDETALIEELSNTPAKEAIELVPKINWDTIENLIYNEKLDASILAPYRRITKTATLRVTRKKGK